MSSLGIFFVTVAVCLVVAIAIAWIASSVEQKKIAAMPEAEREEYLRQKRLESARQSAAATDALYGRVNTMMVCPHCQSKGSVRTKTVKQKKGVSGGKATAAVLTGGVSLLATGLSRKENLTEARCGNCHSVWHF